MSLDQNLFTLFLTPNTSQPAGTVIDLTDNAGTIHYRKRRILSDQQLYRIEVTDPLSDALLASATAPSATSKHKTLELYNPSKVVELKYTGTLTFRWSFKWETHEFEWKREECFIIRKPDPPVLVAVTKEPPGRIKTGSVQILDYNIHRFDIEDRKGLEIVILTALLTFQDASDAYHDSGASATANSPPATAAPTPPPKPPPKKGVERIAELQLGRGQVNEVTVLEEGAVGDYAKYCSQLLRDDAMLFVSVRSSDASQVPKVLQVVEETKRLRYKAGEADLHQYVVHDSKEGTTSERGPRIINLDDTSGKGKMKAYAPPGSLTVHLSKIDMPELRPGGGTAQRTRHGHDGGKKKDKDGSGGRAKEREKGKTKESKDERQTTRPPPVPPRQAGSSSLRKHKSQYLQPVSSASGSYHHVQSVPSRPGASGTRRQSMYGSLRGGEHSYDEHGVERHLGSGSGSATQTSGLFGRLLGR